MTVETWHVKSYAVLATVRCEGERVLSWRVVCDVITTLHLGFLRNSKLNRIIIQLCPFGYRSFYVSSKLQPVLALILFIFQECLCGY